jgi:hypothetical protein
MTFLCPADPDEAGRRYLRLHKKLVGFFQFSGFADPATAADEALDRSARRIAEGAEVPDIDKFCLGIARFIVKEQWRVNSRESATYLQYLEKHESATDVQTERLSLMRECFEQLPQRDRELMNLYCTAPPGRARARYRVNLAEQLSFTVTAMRVRVTRLRQGLDDCVKELVKSRW